MKTKTPQQRHHDTTKQDNKDTTPPQGHHPKSTHMECPHIGRFNRRGPSSSGQSSVVTMRMVKHECIKKPIDWPRITWSHMKFSEQPQKRHHLYDDKVGTVLALMLQKIDKRKKDCEDSASVLAPGVAEHREKTRKKTLKPKNAGKIAGKLCFF